MTPERLDRRREMFRQYARSPDAETALAFLWDHTALLDAAVCTDLRDWVRTGDPTLAEMDERRIQGLEAFADELAKDPRSWPPAGPIERLADRVANTELTPAEAAQMAADPGFADAVGSLYAEVCAFRAEGRARNGDFRTAVRLFAILLAGLDAQDEPDWIEARGRIVWNWLNTASLACTSVPDGAWFTDAAARGEAVLTNDAPSLPALMQGALWHALGVLHLDPYVAGRTQTALESQLQAWRNRLTAEYGVLEAQEARHAMPPMEAATNQAADYFRCALPLREGSARGETLKALAEALFWREVAGGPADRPAVIAAAQEALGLLSPADDPQRIAALRQLLSHLGATADAAPATAWDALLKRNPEDVIAELGETLAFERYIWAIRSARPPIPKTLDLVGRLWPHVSASDDESAKLNLAQEVGDVLMSLTTDEGLLPAPVDELAARAAEVQAAPDDDPSAAHKVGRLMALALSSAAEDQEAVGLPIAEAAVAVAGDAPWRGLLEVLQAALIYGAAADAYNAKDMGPAATHYGEALVAYARLGMTGAAVQVLSRLEDIVFSASSSEFASFILSLTRAAPHLDRPDRPGLGERVQQLWRQAFGYAFQDGRANPEVLAVLFQAAKGEALALAAFDAKTADWRTDPQAVDLLTQIAPLRAAAPEFDAPDDQLDDEDLLCAFSSRVSTSATGPAAAAARMEEHFDDRLRRETATAVDPLEVLTTAKALQASLGPKTVFLTHYLGTTEVGRPALFSFLLTSEAGFGAVGEIKFPAQAVQMTGADREIIIHSQGLSVAQLRRSVVEDPGPAVVSSDAEDALTEDRQLLGGGLAEHLADLRAAGKDHLCVHPYGAYHFYPLHLIGGAEHCLADDWTVSTVPHPILLRRPPPPDGPTHLVAFSLSFTDRQPHGLDPLPATSGEAAAVAELMGGQHLQDDDATESAFIAALGAATHIHVATHGSQRVGAPAFQKLYLTPDGDGDGVFNAYEALGRDLRHVQLVTLSACETGLGRFDGGDNLRGLAANLLASGVGAIVSTLWPIADEVSHSFFVSLYREIAQGRPRLDAFRSAQTATRASFPAFVDWGAFQYSGSW